MHLVIVAGALTTAAAFLAATVLLMLSWKGRRAGALLIVATAVTCLWGAFLAYSEWNQNVSGNWIVLVELLRYGAWLLFLDALLRVIAGSGAMQVARLAVQTIWLALALYYLLSAFRVVTLAPGSAALGVLLIALVAVVLLEQVFRNMGAGQRWALKFLVIGLGAMFAYDIILYSYAALYRHLDGGMWAARGFVDAMVAPLVVVAAARNPSWSLNVGVSRRAVFYSTGLLVVASYMVATAVGGYYVRVYGGDWGRVAEVTLLCLALVALAVVASSGQARSRLRVFLHKNFYSFRHDYRDEWLRLTEALSRHDDAVPLALRAVRALARIMDSPGGVLLWCGDRRELVCEASWNMPVASGLALATDLPLFAFMREHRWIYDLTAPPPGADERLGIPAGLENLRYAWLLVPLAVGSRLVGCVVLARARAPRALDWEDLDLLRTAGSQVAFTLAQADDARRVAEMRQFEGFNRLTAYLMHDLKNIAAQQGLLLQNAVQHKSNPAFIEDMLATVDNSVRRITTLLAQLRGETSVAAVANVRLRTIAEQAVAACTGRQPEPSCRWLAGADPWVCADAQQLTTVLAHLIRNAQDATMAHGHVKVELGQSDDQALLRIEDDGTGMDGEFIRTRLFAPFFTTKASRGMGIGAYQAREYVRSLQGALEVESTPGKGSVFTVKIPLVKTGDGVDARVTRRALS